MADTGKVLNDEELSRISGGYTGPTFVYVIQEGDQLSVIAQRFGTTVRVLREINDIRDASSLQTGTRILIPQR